MRSNDKIYIVPNKLHAYELGSKQGGNNNKIEIRPESRLLILNSIFDNVERRNR